MAPVHLQQIELPLSPDHCLFVSLKQGREVGIVLVELSSVEKRYDAPKEVLEQKLSVVEVAERYGGCPTHRS